MNKVILIGRLTKDPELKKTANGNSVCSFRIALDRKFKDANGNKQTDFINIVAWRQLADIIGQYFSKGSRIGITGSLQSRSYDDQNGQKVSVTEVLAEDIDFLDPKQKTEEKEPETQQNPSEEYEEATLPFDVAGY